MKYTIRVANEFDAVDIQRIYEPFVENTPVTFEVTAPDVSDMRRRIVETLVHFPYLVCESNGGEVVGYAYASQHRVRLAYQWSVDVSVYVEDEFQRNGIGTSLYRPLLSLLAMQGYCTAYAGITLPNDGSVRLHESLGFTKVGVFHDTGYKLGEWRDVGWWELQIRSYDHTPEPPVPFVSIAASREARDQIAGVPTA